MKTSCLKQLRFVPVVMLTAVCLAGCVSSNEQIHTAAVLGDTEKVRFLLKRNPQLANAKDVNGRTPLHCAASRGDKDIIELLLSRGADINARDFNEKGHGGYTQLHGAAIRGQKEIAELLLAHGCDVNARNDHLETPLFVAAESGHKEIVELLLAHHADINLPNGAGNTPLSWVVRTWGSKDMIEFLINKGTDIGKKDDEEKTAFEYAVERKHTDIIALLKSHSVQAKP